MSLVAYSDDSEEEDMYKDGLESAENPIDESSPLKKSDTDQIACFDLSSDSCDSVEGITDKPSHLQKLGSVPKEASNEDEMACFDISSDSSLSIEEITDKSSQLQKVDSIAKESTSGVGSVSSTCAKECDESSRLSIISTNSSFDSDSSVEVINNKSSPIKKLDSLPKDSSKGVENVCCSSGKESDESFCLSTMSTSSSFDSDSSVQVITDKSSPVKKPDSIPDESRDELAKVSLASGKDKSLFYSLPRPVTTSSDVDLGRQEVKDTSKGYKRKPVKISIPSLDYETEEKEEVTPKKPKMMPKGSRLFAILPPPKKEPTKEVKRPLVPNVLTKKAGPTSVPGKSELVGEHQKLAQSIALQQTDNSDSGDESGGEGNYGKSKDFFSLSEVKVDDTDDKLEDTLEIKLSSGSSSDTDLNILSAENSSSSGSLHPPSLWTTFLPREDYKKSSPGEGCSGNVAATDAASMSVEQPVTGGDLGLDEEAFKRLGGPRYKRQMQAVEVIDINEDTILPDSNEWLTKQLTIETNPKIHGHSHRKNDGPTTQQRRKHQITYLAFQAKEKELELKNQWSQNRMSRKQTQSKYGF